MKRLIFFLFIIICMVVPKIAFAQYEENVSFGSSPNPVGSGARAIGMGGAFIAIADDATAASWNPGGLIQLELPEISFVGAGFQRTQNNTFGISPEGNGRKSVSQENLNYLSVAYPFGIRGYNMIISLNYQHLYNFDRQWRFSLALDSAGDTAIYHYEYEKDGSLYALGIAYSIQINPAFSLGVTLNIWDDSLYENKWEEKTLKTNFLNGEEFKARYDDRYRFSGLNANIGFLWNITSRLTVGGIFKTPFKADLEHESERSGTNYKKPVSSYDKFILDMPMSYGIGFAYRFSDALTASFDIYRTEWDDFLLTDDQGKKTSPITGKSGSDIDPTHQIRMGAEYLFIRSKYVVPLRCGLFYDPAPAEESPDNFFGFSLGSGIVWKRFVFDIAYQFRYGNDVGESLLTNMDFSQDVKEHMLYSSVIIHF